MKHFLTITLVLYLSACGWLGTFRESTDEQFAAAAASYHYSSALAIAEKALNNAKEDQQKEFWQRQIDDVYVWAEKFQAEEIAEIDELLKQENWLDANKKVRFLAEHLPASESLSQFQAEFEEKRLSRVDSLNRSLLLLESKQIPDSLHIYDLIYQANDESALSFERLQKERDKRDQVIKSLEAGIAEAEQTGDYRQALIYARAMQRLQDSPDVLSRIRQIRQELSQQRTPPAGRSALTESQKTQLNEYGKAVLEERWIAARTILNAMLSERPTDGELLGQDTYLKETFVEKVAAAREKGEQLYSEGNIEEALATWQSVAEMAPNDVQLAANIERAQRILDKVRALKADASEAQTIEQN